MSIVAVDALWWGRRYSSYSSSSSSSSSSFYSFVHPCQCALHCHYYYYWSLNWIRLTAAINSSFLKDSILAICCKQLVIRRCLFFKKTIRLNLDFSSSHDSDINTPPPRPFFKWTKLFVSALGSTFSTLSVNIKSRLANWCIAPISCYYVKFDLQQGIVLFLC